MKHFSTLLFASALMMLAACNKQGNYQTTANGLKYQIITDAKAEKAKKGEYIVYNTTWRTTQGENIFSTNNSNPVSGVVPDSMRFKGDPNEILSMLGKGDSASLLVSADQFFGDVKMPDHVKKGDMIKLDIKVLDVMTAEAYQQFVAANKPMDPEMQNILNYINEKKLVAEAENSGLFIVTDKKGDGKPLANGMKVTMNYSGHLLDGTAFDSNVDPQFNHVQPFSFTIGQGQVIKGWDEGVLHFNVGGKGKLIVPSKIGYGMQGMPPKIPGNASLVFDIEVVSAE